MSTQKHAQAAIAALKLLVEYRPIDELRPHPRSPRKHPKSKQRKLMANIQANGFLVPIVVDGTGQVLAGHARLLAARELGMAEVPAIRIDHLSDAQAQSFMIADNRLNELSSWDDQILGEILLGLSLQNLDVSLELTGFDMGEIDLRIEGLEQVGKQAAPDRADKLPDPVAGTPVCKPGDLWLLGRHRVFCGSALDQASYAVLMAGEQAAMVFTDPPYNVPIQGHVSGLGAIRHREFAMACGETTAGRATPAAGAAGVEAGARDRALRRHLAAHLHRTRR